ncbi:hypothetical protein HDF24_16060 [Mucilaginibacter sp. X4EP1]|uniref:hypothetical protein n=1 Tax=Mucilaginibacter sp. X4EP1 TaxID=2723092 RepID=UPI0021690F37|nr:hypothetical protein [Mucilaginibacter sp. X4EP1]MCS3814876.1 hypothetical protein [Mucilaginibacter sp. X4EP1]
MKNAKSYISALTYQKKTFDLIEDYIKDFNKVETVGYVFSEKRTDNSIDLIIGSGKFTMLSFIQGDGVIVFNVFGWEFDLSSLTRYSSLKIDKLTLEKRSNALEFKYPQLDEDKQTFTVIIDLDDPYKSQNIERLFNALEHYIDNKDGYVIKSDY